jgi:hypothetical protein
LLKNFEKNISSFGIKTGRYGSAHNGFYKAFITCDFFGVVFHTAVEASASFGVHLNQLATADEKNVGL